MAKRVTLIFGDEYLVSEKGRQTVDAIVPPAQQVFGLEIIDGRADTVAEAVACLGKCLEALLTVGFFGDQKVIWFRDVGFLTDTVVGRSESVKTRVEELARLIKGGLSDGQTLVVSAPRVDKRYAFFKACKAAGEVVEFAVAEKAYQSEQQARERLSGLLPKFGVRMSASVAGVFLGRVGTDTRNIVNELSKLAVYLGGRQDATEKDVSAVVCASRTAVTWDLTDAIGDRKLGPALVILRQLLFQRESPIGLLMGIESLIRDLSVFREALERRWLVAPRSGRASGAGISWGVVPPDGEAILASLEKDPRTYHPFRAGKLAQQAQNFKPRELRRCHEAAVETHAKLVSSSLSPQILLELFLAKMLA